MTETLNALKESINSIEDQMPVDMVEIDLKNAWLLLGEIIGDTSSTQIFSLPETFVATVIAFVIGYAVIAWILKYVTTKSFVPFIAYRIGLGSLLLIALSTGMIS